MNPIPTLQGSGDGALSQSPVTKVTEASQEFESVLLGQWLQEAQSSFGSVPGYEDDSAGSGEIKEFAMQHLAAGIVSSGGIGIAKLVEVALTSALSKDHSAGTESAQHQRGSNGHR